MARTLLVALALVAAAALLAAWWRWGTLDACEALVRENAAAAVAHGYSPLAATLGARAAMAKAPPGALTQGRCATALWKAHVAPGLGLGE